MSKRSFSEPAITHQVAVLQLSLSKRGFIDPVITDEDCRWYEICIAVSKENICPNIPNMLIIRKTCDTGNTNEMDILKPNRLQSKYNFCKYLHKIVFKFVLDGKMLKF